MAGLQAKRPHLSSYWTGTDNPRAILTEPAVREIRRRYAEGGGAANGGPSQKELGSQYDVTRETVWCLVNRKTWKHIP